MPLLHFVSTYGMGAQPSDHAKPSSFLLRPFAIISVVIPHEP